MGQIGLESNRNGHRDSIGFLNITSIERNGVLMKPFIFSRAIISAVGGLRRPQYDLSPKNFANIFNKAAGITLEPPLDPYANTVNYLLASYAIPYVGLVGYVAALPALTKPASRGVRNA